MRQHRLVLTVLLGIPLIFSPAWASEEQTPDVAAAPPDPVGALDVYDPLFDEELDEEDSELDSDPFEWANRGVFGFNDGLDRWVLDPITRGYQWVVPPPARRGVNRFFANLNSPVVFANQLLQLRPVPAATTIGRFAVNTTFGIAGFFDFADDVMGLGRVEADFGQTLHRYGIPRGPYLVVPLFGPSTARDAVGTVIDQALDPLTYIIGPLNLQWQLILGGGQGLAVREANADAMDALREASVDFYAALRSAYLQSRRARELEIRPVFSSAPGEKVSEGVTFQDSSVPVASLAIRSSIAAMSASKFSLLTIPENSERLSASSLTVPSR